MPEGPTTPTTPTTPQDYLGVDRRPAHGDAGTRPALRLTIAGTAVRTSADTVVQRRGDTQDLSVLQIGMTIDVVGDRQGDGSIDARRLQIKDDATGAEFEIEGSVGGLKGTCPAVTFGVNGFSVATTSATTFTPACADLEERQQGEGPRHHAGGRQCASGERHSAVGAAAAGRSCAGLRRSPALYLVDRETSWRRA